MQTWATRFGPLECECGPANTEAFAGYGNNDDLFASDYVEDVEWKSAQNLLAHVARDCGSGIDLMVLDWSSWRLTTQHSAAPTARE